MPIHKDDFAYFMKQAQIKIPGASDAGIKEELFDVLDEFCEDSLAWRETLTIPILAGTTTGNVSSNTTYTLTPQDGGYIFMLIGVWDPNNIPQPAYLPTGEGGGVSIGLLTFVNPYNINQTMSVAVAKTVTLPNDAKEVPIFSETLFRRWHRYILDGLVGKMMDQPNKSFTDQKQADYHLRRWESGKAMARTQTERENTYGAQAWSFPQGFRTRGQRGGVSTANPTQF